jgi:surface polysaccharide O-acyltransferase-like enzyme
MLYFPRTEMEIPMNSSKLYDTVYLNTLRVIAIFAVIMIHVFSPINRYFLNSLTKVESYACIVLTNLWQWCVPIFVMITGVLFHNPKKEITLKRIFQKYVFKTYFVYFNIWNSDLFY